MTKIVQEQGRVMEFSRSPNRDKKGEGMNFYHIKNWSDFQHYGKRNPPWIKLHRALLDDYAFCSLPDAAKGHLMLIWVLASQNNGMVPVDVAFLERKLSCTGIDLDLLIERGFLVEPAVGKGASK